MQVHARSSYLERQMNCSVESLHDLHLTLTLTHPIETNVELDIAGVG